MIVDLNTILPADFSNDSKIWIYQSNRTFTMGELFQIEEALENFIENWNSHGAAVKGFGTVLYGQFIILMADETNTSVGGCSTDSSVHLIKAIEKMTGVSLFNRELLAFWIKDKVQTIPLTQVSYALQNGLFAADTLYFNNLVNTKKAMETQWMQPIQESWLGNKMK